MTMTVDQKFNFLHMSFHEVDPETLFVLLQDNEYDINETFKTIYQMEGITLKPPSRTQTDRMEVVGGSSLQQQQRDRDGMTLSTSEQKSARRGAHVSLPSDFLRWPSSSQSQPLSSPMLASTNAKDYMNLLSDPNVLAELEREFGPNFEAVIREHLQAEALRNTENYASYSTGFQNTSTGRDFNNKESISNQALSDTPRPQQEIACSNQEEEPQEALPTTGTTSSISDRFYNILNKFVGPKKIDKRKTEESTGLLSRKDNNSEEEEEEEECSFLNPSNMEDDVEMRPMENSRRRYSYAEEDLEDDTDRLLRERS